MRGAQAQLSMAQGECGELIAEITKCFIQHKSTKADVASEIADVEIMMEQLRLIVGTETVDRIKAEKLARLESILNGTAAHPHQFK